MVRDVVDHVYFLSGLVKHLGLWEVKPRPPPRMPKSKLLYNEPHIDYSDSQVLCKGKNLSLGFLLKSGALVWLGKVR